MLSTSEQCLPPSDRSDAPDTPLSPLSAPHTAAMAAMAEARERIPGDVVNKATAALPDNERSAIRRFHAHYMEQDLTLNEAAKLIYVSSATLSLTFRGKYDGKIANVVTAIERFFELEDRRNQGRKLQFIPTKLTDRIWKVCDAALEFQRCAFVFGDSQIGKSESLAAYATSHNHGSTIYLSVPTGGHISHFLCRLADTLRISARLRPAELRQRIIGAFDSRMLLIVDEAHQCIIEHAYSTCRLQTIEFIREIFDQTHCGLVICATKVFQEAMERGALEKLLRQMKRRRLCAPESPRSAHPTGPQHLQRRQRPAPLPRRSPQARSQHGRKRSPRHVAHPPAHGRQARQPAQAKARMVPRHHRPHRPPPARNRLQLTYHSESPFTFHVSRFTSINKK